MWERSELKRRGKENFKKTYWLSVIVTLIFLVVTGGLYNGDSNRNKNSYQNQFIEIPQEAQSIYGKADKIVTPIANSFSGFQIANDINNSLSSFLNVTLGLTVFGAVIALGIIISLLISIPFEVGKNRFFLENRDYKSKVGAILYSYKNNRIGNTVWTMFLRNLFTVLWSLLLIVPGIIKAYEYRMIPYILAENPDLPKDRIFDLSKNMMMGNKMEAFILDLSFLGWIILNAFTFELLGIFYVYPYIEATNAELYSVLRDYALTTNLADYTELPGFIAEYNQPYNPF